MATFDECMEKLPQNIQEHINAITDAAGTFDADFAVLQAAGERCAAIAERLKKMTESRDDWRNMYVERGRSHER